jgi:methylenetetrahydrofolate reductase (NADPH)
MNNRTQAMKPMKTDLRQALERDRLVLTAECLPPRSGGAEAVGRLSTVLPPCLDAVVVADNPDEIHGSAMACAAVLAREGREVVLTMSTRDRNRIALESDALGASTLGIGAILCVDGNHQSLGACPQAAGANDMDSIQLTRALKDLGVPGLVIGAVAHPYQQPLELNLIRLKKKIAAGAEFLLTQPVFDTAGFALWMDTVRTAGLDKGTAVIASVLPLTTLDKAEAVRKSQIYGPLDETVMGRLAASSDVAKEGLAIVAEIIGRLKTIPGVRGIHILSGGCEAVAGEIIQAAGLV